MTETSSRNQHVDPGDNVPIPDPSLLTTQQLQREIFGLRELLEVKLGSSSEAAALIRQIVETRLDGMDKAIRLLQSTADEFPARIDEKITALREVHAEKFDSIQTQFEERDVRTEQSSKDSKVAVDAALQAAKELVGEQSKSSALAIAKSETAATKQIDQLGVLIQQMDKAFDDKISDLKDRLTRAEGVRTGSGVAWAAIGGVVMLLLALAGFFGLRASQPEVRYLPQPVTQPAPAAPR